MISLKMKAAIKFAVEDAADTINDRLDDDE